MPRSDAVNSTTKATRTTGRGARWVAIVRLAMVACLLAALSAQEPPAVPPCTVCKSAGSIPCGKHGKDLAQELASAGTVFCSVVAECKACAGALATDCARCTNPPVEAELARRKQLAHDWLARRRKSVDDAVGHAVLHLETTHVDLVCAVKPQMVGKEKLETHALMHLYGTRIEELRTLYQQQLELGDQDMPGRLRVYMFREEKDQGVIGPRETGFGNARAVGLKQMGPEFVYSMWQEPRSVPGDEALHRNLVHNVTHLLTSQVLPVLFLGNKSHGWIDEGLAHWFEDKVTGRCLNYCFEEILTTPGSDWKGGRWRTPVRVMVDEGKAPAFASVCTLNTDQLKFEDHAIAFAYVDFLITEHGGKKFRDLLRHVKSNKPLRDGLQELYGVNPLTIEEPFQKWVKVHNPPVAPR